jgi:hypothetical protein
MQSSLDRWLTKDPHETQQAELEHNEQHEEELQRMKVEKVLGGDSVRLGQKIRIEREGLPVKTGYAYKQEGTWLGIRYTWRSMRWWSLLNYNNPLTKLEAQESDEKGGTYWVTLWEREGE